MEAATNAGHVDKISVGLDVAASGSRLVRTSTILTSSPVPRRKTPPCYSPVMSLWPCTLTQ